MKCFFCGREEFEISPTAAHRVVEFTTHDNNYGCIGAYRRQECDAAVNVRRLKVAGREGRLSFERG